MLYRAYEARRTLAAPLFGLAGAGSEALRRAPENAKLAPLARLARATALTIKAMELTHECPPFGIERVTTPEGEVAVVEQTVLRTPFASLRYFAKPGADVPGPPVLILPGLAGHFATLVRSTVRTMLADHDVYVADWHNARDVPIAAGRFGLDEFIQHIVDFLRHIGPGGHLVAICQPCAAAMAATALMAEDGDPARPRSLTLMAGPVDARVNPGPVNAFAARQSLDNLERRVIATVPPPHAGAGRRVYPGFLQVVGFMSLAPRRHVRAFADLFADVARGREVDAARTATFYAEYFAVLDIAAEMYLDTARAVFTEHDLARGVLTCGGRRVVPRAITDTTLLTVEAENDEMCPPGQTSAAHGLCTGLPAGRKQRYLQEGVGHYGIFTGTRFEAETYPVIRDVIARAAVGATAAA